jgi:glutathione S-transferase
MSEITVIGFPRSTFVQIVRLILTHKEAPYTFRDLEPEMGTPAHLALHPFNRVPILQHGEFTLYETNAIALYLEEIFPTPALQPGAHAPMDQRSEFLLLPLHDLSRLARAERVSATRHPLRRKGGGTRAAEDRGGACAMEQTLDHGKPYLLGAELTLADFYMLPSTNAFGLAPESKAMYPKFPAFCRWRETMEGLSTVQRFRALQPPRAPIEHAREWAISHRPKY